MEIKIEAKTIDRKGKHPSIIIPKSIFENAEELFNTNLFKRDIINDKQYTYYWKYRSKRKQEITFKDLKPGKYKVKIKPFGLINFLKEFNKNIKRKFSFTLNLEKDMLITNFKGIYVSTKAWMFDKEKGCGIAILAKYPSKTRTGQEVIVKYQLKMGKANIWIVEPRDKERPAVYKVEDIYTESDSINLYYRHGKKLKTTSINIINFLLPIEYKPKAKALNINTPKKLLISGFKIKKYLYSISDDEVYRDLTYLIKMSYSELKRGNEEEFRVKEMR